jgi:predicted nuclease of predicted toxin-antitoxin system
MRFIADENVPRHVIDRLRADGFDVTLIEGPLSGVPDREVLRAAEGEARFLITADRILAISSYVIGFGCAACAFRLERLSNPAKAIGSVKS